MPPAPQASASNSMYHEKKIVSNNGPVVDKETVIVFDWDDTLLCSTFLSSRGIRLDSDKSRLIEHSAALRELEQAILTVLTQALQYGQVHVITNAETGWVELSCQKFIPAVLPMLSKLQIISARSTFESRYPDSPLKWKFYAFQERLAPLFAENVQKMKNVLSFGDSHVEREAVRAVTRGYPNTRCKSVKFAERPTIEQLRRQLELLNNCMTYIHNHAGDLDLQLTVTVNNKNAAQANQKQAVNPLNEKVDKQAPLAHSYAQDVEEKPYN